MPDLPIRLDDLDDFVARVKEEHLAEPMLPPTVAFVYHDGLLSAFFEPPTFYCLESADEITSTLTRLLPALVPDAVAVLLPAAYDPVLPDMGGPGGELAIDGAGLWWAMKVYRWERRDDGTTRWRARLMPMPLDGSPDGPMFDLDDEAATQDPLAGALRGALDRPRRTNGFLLDLAWLPKGWEGLARPGGPFDPGACVGHPN